MSSVRLDRNSIALSKKGFAYAPQIIWTPGRPISVAFRTSGSSTKKTTQRPNVCSRALLMLILVFAPPGRRCQWRWCPDRGCRGVPMLLGPGCLSRKTALAMVFKLILSARAKWRKLDGSNNLAEVIEGVPFKDGIKQMKYAA